MNAPGGTGRCAGCGVELAPTFLSCPACGRLVHGESLRRLATDAEAAGQRGDTTTALAAWREALELLPPQTRQHQIVSQKVEALSRQVDSQPAAGATSAARPPAVPTPTARPTSAQGRKKWGAVAGVGALGMLLWKLKFVVTFALTKGKLLLLGLTKGSTFFSMLLSLGVYWTAWGWKFALGVVISIYIHEMGHVAALRRYGIKASAPMFVPGLGAMVRLKQYPASAREDARVGLAGPLWGAAAAIGAYAVYLATGWESWGAIARVGAWINLFNLLPVWQLDGGRGFRAIVRWQRWALVVALAGMWILVKDGLLVLLLIFAGFRALTDKSPVETDWNAFAQFLLLILVLSATCLIPV